MVRKHHLNKTQYISMEMNHLWAKSQAYVIIIEARKHPLIKHIKFILSHHIIPSKESLHRSTQGITLLGQHVLWFNGFKSSNMGNHSSRSTHSKKIHMINPENHSTRSVNSKKPYMINPMSSLTIYQVRLIRKHFNLNITRTLSTRMKLMATCRGNSIGTPQPVHNMTNTQ